MCVRSLKDGPRISAALLTWSLPGVVGRRLADALFCRVADEPEDSWTWFDVDRIHVTGCFKEPPRCVNFSRAERTINALDSTRRDIAIAALRWWRQGREAESPADMLVAFWIVLESASSARHRQAYRAEGRGIALQSLSIIVRMRHAVQGKEDEKGPL